MNRLIKSILSLVLFSGTKITVSQNFASSYNGSKFICGVNGFKTDSTNNRLLMYGNILDVACTLNNNYLAINTNNIWSFLGPFNHSIFSTELYNNEIYCSGWFTNVSGNSISNLAKYNGTNWLSVPNFISAAKPYNLKVINNELYLSGDIIYTTDGVFNGLAKFNGTNWSGFNIPFLGSGSYILDFCFYKGELYLGGNFRLLPNYESDLIYYHNNQWQKVGIGIDGANGEVKRLAVLNNILYIGGLIYKNDGNPSNMIIAWDGSNLLPVGDGLKFNINTYTTAQIHDMKVKNGKLYIAGGFNYAGNIFSCGLTIFDGNTFCSANKTPQVSSGLSAIGFYKDTLWVAGSDKYLTDSIKRVGKFVGNNLIDTCSISYNVSLPEIQLGNDKLILVSPNPTKEILCLAIKSQNNSKFIIEILNVNGQLCKKEILESNLQSININVSILNKGLYTIRIITPNQIFHSKFIKE